MSLLGVVPSDATIADGSYPLAGYNYAVVRADEPKDSLARRMVEFMTGDVGQNCVGNAGFGPLSSGPKADFQRDFPHRELETVFPPVWGMWLFPGTRTTPSCRPTAWSGATVTDAGIPLRRTSARPRRKVGFPPPFWGLRGTRWSLAR